jgi:uncharacterized membrane protein YgcG
MDDISPAVKAREFVQEARAAITALSRLAKAEAAPPPAPTPEPSHEGLSGFTGFLLGAAIPVLIFIMAWILMHGSRPL